MGRQWFSRMRSGVRVVLGEGFMEGVMERPLTDIMLRIWLWMKERADHQAASRKAREIAGRRKGRRGRDWGVAGGVGDVVVLVVVVEALLVGLVERVGAWGGFRRAERARWGRPGSLGRARKGTW